MIKLLYPVSIEFIGFLSTSFMKIWVEGPFLFPLMSYGQLDRWFLRTQNAIKKFDGTPMWTNNI
jgi:hypothetical protein